MAKLITRILVFLYASAFLGLTPASVIAAQSGSGNASALSGLATVRQRFVQSLLPSGSAAIDYLHTAAARDAASLKPDGSWPDIDYAAQQRSVWTTADHLDRVLLMAKSARAYRDSSHPDAALEAQITLALQWWTDHDYQNPNWWWNQIGIPELLGQIGNLMLPQIPSDQLTKMVAIMKRSDWRGGSWTGANLTWGVGIEIARGCMQYDPAAVAEGYARMYDEIKIVSPLQEGIQQDYSFHQHGAQLYNGGYGLDFAEDVARFISFSWGTRFQIPPDRMAIFSSYLLDGEQWFIRGPAAAFDYSSVGREITRPAGASSLKKQSAGPIYPALGAVYGLARAVTMLAAEPTPRQSQLQAFAARMRGDANAPAFTGNKQFWCSDYMAQRRKGYFTSVKMLSQRMLNAELVNSEGKKSVHLSDGANFLYLTGDEYLNIFPAWDWTKIPGTTAIQGTLQTGEPNPIDARGQTSFDGGVSDGTYGLAAMNLKRGDLVANKAWFFFDSSYVALGAGITLADDSDRQVATSVNQPLLNGEVLSSQSSGPLSQGSYGFDSPKRAWIYHDRVGYIFAPDTHISLSLGPQTGKWSDIGTGPDKPVTVNVFNLWIDHGNAPQDASYEYTVLPNATAAQVAQRAANPLLRVLSNSTAIQAVYNPRLKLAEIVFRQPAYIWTPIGTVRTDHECLLLVRQTNAGWRVTASDPQNVPLSLTITINEKPTTIQLPGGNSAGSSVSVDVQRPVPVVTESKKHTRH